MNNFKITFSGLTQYRQLRNDLNQLVDLIVESHEHGLMITVENKSYYYDALFTDGIRGSFKKSETISITIEARPENCPPPFEE